MKYILIWFKKQKEVKIFGDILICNVWMCFFVKWSNTAGWKWLILQNSNSSGIATLGNEKKKSFLWIDDYSKSLWKLSLPICIIPLCYQHCWSQQYAGCVLYELCNRPRSPMESLWLSGRALECGIRRSEVWFLMGTRNFFFVPYSWNDGKHLSLLFL